MAKIVEDYAEWYMKRLYDVIYGSDFWTIAHQGRAEPHIFYRHIIRYFLRQDSDLTLKEISIVEGKLIGKQPTGHDSISNSIKVVEEQLIGDPIFIKCQDVRTIVFKEYKQLYKQQRIKEAIAAFFTSELQNQFEWLTEFINKNPDIGKRFEEYIHDKTKT